MNSFDQRALGLHDTLLQQADPLMLDLEDDEFIRVINQSIDDSKAYYEGKHLGQRQDKNVAYYMGQQFNPDAVPNTQTPYVENIVYEAIQRIRPIALSRLPDLTVKPGGLDQGSITSAKTLSDVFNTDVNTRAIRKLLGLAHVHEQLYFFSVIKARWNTEKGRFGDYEFLNVHPKNIVWDHTCKTNDADDMRFIAESCEFTLKDVIMMFPKKEKEFLDYLGIEADKRQSSMATPCKIWQVFFHWYKETTDENHVVKWEKIQAVVWKYGQFVLGKMRNPYFDYQGKMQLFTREMKEKALPTIEDMKTQLFGADDQTQVIYYNYFKNPRKPYFFMVYESLGADPIDATNRVEQILYFQDHINKEGTQIIGMNERSAGKAIFNTDMIEEKTVTTLDWMNFRQAIKVTGPVNEAATVFMPPPAPSQLYTSKSADRSVAFEMLGLNADTRGLQETGDTTLGQSQMAREQDFGFIDNLVEETINEAAEWMAQWSMQFIRVFYTKPHLVDAIGKDGEGLYISLTQDVVSDGMSVEVSASGVDKQMRKQMATQNMQMGVGDLLSYYEDTEQDNPKERARRAFLMKASPQQYYLEFLAPKDQEVAGPVQPGQGMPPNPGQDPSTIQAPPSTPTLAPAGQSSMGPGGPPSTGMGPATQGPMG